MIIEIALGIVLAVLILKFFYLILAFALIALAIAVVLVIVGVAVYFAFTEPLVSAIIAGAAALIWGGVYWATKHGYMTQSPNDPPAPATVDINIIRMAIAFKALWQGMSPMGRRSTAGIGALLLAALAWRFIYVSTPEEVIGVAVFMTFAATVFAPLLVLDWIRARKQKPPFDSP